MEDEEVETAADPAAAAAAEEELEMLRAATKIQAAHRGKQARKDMVTLKAAKEDDKTAKAASTIGRYTKVRIRIRLH